MEYDVKTTDYAREQMKKTVTYISKILLSPQTAVSWLDIMEKEINKLCDFPRRYPLIEEKPWGEKGIRKMLVGNFFVYYWIDEERKTVWINAVVYARSEQLPELKNISGN